MPPLLSLFFARIDKMSSAEPVIRSRQAAKEVNGIPTQVVCTEFSNYIFVVLTQYGKIGTLISVTPDSRSNDISTPTFSTKVLLGKEEVWSHSRLNEGICMIWSCPREIRVTCGRAGVMLSCITIKGQR